MRAATLTAMTLLTIASCGGGVGGSSTTELAGENREIPHRILVDGLEGGGRPWTTGLVDSESELRDLAPDTDVDRAREVVFRFTLAESSTCPFDEMQTLEFSEPDLRVYPVVPLVGEPEICTDDAMPHTIVVAVATEDLPEGEFSLWVSADDPPSALSDGVTRFAAGELGDPGESSIETLDASGELPVGETRIAYDVTTHCGLDQIYREIAGTQWELADNGEGGIDYIPPGWESAIIDEQVDLILERPEPDLLVVSAVGTDTRLAYSPAARFEGCD